MSQSALPRAAQLPTISSSANEEAGWLAMYREIFGDLARSRELVEQFVLRDLRMRYKQAVIGFGWALLMPLLIVCSGILVRFAMAQSSGRQLQPEIIGAMAVKAIPWAFFAGALGLAAQSLLANKALITKIYFPREVIPFSTTLAQGVDSAIGAGVVAVILIVLRLPVTWTALWVPGLLLLLFTFTLGVALFVACANLFFRDVKYIVQVFLTFGIFVTPVFFEPQMFGAVGARILMLNPISPIIEGLRLSLIDGHNLARPLVELTRSGAEVLVWSPWYLVYTGLVAVIGLLLSLRLFRSMTYLFAEYA
jgi:lipopolysaccharide transport system permease protein